VVRRVVSERPLLLALLLAAMAASLLTPPGASQVPLPACTFQTSVLPPTLEHQPGEALHYNFTASAPQTSLGGTVTVTVQQATEGWTATVEPSSFNVAAGGQETADVLVTAPLSGPRQAQVALQASMQCAGGAFATTQSQTLTPTLAAASTPPTGGSPAAGGDVALWAVGIVLLLILVVAALLLTRRRSAPLQLTTPSARREVAAGGGASFTLEALNRGQEVVVAVLEVSDPQGTGAESWSVIPPPSELTLEPGAARSLQVLLRSPLGAQPGDKAHVDASLWAPAGGKAVRVRLEAVVQGSIATGVPGPRPRVLVRDEASLGPET